MPTKSFLFGLDTRVTSMRRNKKSRRHFVPGDVGLGISVQKEHRWSVAFVKNRNRRSARANLGLHKAGKKLRRDICRRLRWQLGQRYGFHGDSLRRLNLVGKGSCSNQRGNR